MDPPMAPKCKAENGPRAHRNRATSSTGWLHWKFALQEDYARTIHRAAGSSSGSRFFLAGTNDPDESHQDYCQPDRCTAQDHSRADGDSGDSGPADAAVSEVDSGRAYARWTDRQSGGAVNHRKRTGSALGAGRSEYVRDPPDRAGRRMAAWREGRLSL